MKSYVAAVFGLLLLTPASHAAVLIDTAEIGNDVVFSFSGTFNFLGLNSLGSGNDNEAASPSVGGILFSGSGQPDNYQMQDKLPSFGSAGFTLGIATGDVFKLYTNNPTILGFAPGYKGGLISGNLTIANSTFITLGLLAGIYKTTASNGDFVQLNIPDATSTIPLPAALPLLAAGLGAMGFAGWRRKRNAVA